MGRQRESAVERHRKWARLANDPNRPFVPPAGLVARPAIPRSKHKTILEWTENADKKKKLEIERTTNTKPNANFSFVPIGHPELTSLCKELSREQGALVYIVSTTKEKGVGLSDHVHRVGYHFRTHIVDQAASMVEDLPPLNPDLNFNSRRHAKDNPDPIPDTQEEIDKQADAAIRDLYPRIPNTDRGMIIRHAFQKGAVFHGKPVVGLQADLALSRRVQLAVVAHIRHTHTRYDLLLRETSWENARRTVEPLCLDILVKWRGDEETGRDQLDEILREIVVIDDSDEDEEDEDDDDESGTEEGEIEDDDLDVIMEDALAISDSNLAPETRQTPTAEIGGALISQKPDSREGPSSTKAPMGTRLVRPESRTNVYAQKHISYPGKEPGISSRTRSKVGTYQPNLRKVKKSRRGRKRYQAWQDALNRRNQRHTGPRSPSEHISENAIIEIDNSPVAIHGKVAIEQNSTMSENIPPNLDYQSIYAIDGSRGPSRLKTRLASPGMARFSERPLRDQTIGVSHDRNSERWERNYHDSSRPVDGIVTYGQFSPQSKFSDGNRVIRTPDVALPSIEQPEVSPIQSPGRVVSNGSPRYSKVRYGGVDDNRHPPPPRSYIDYINGGELENEVKRRRIMVSDHSFVPTSMRNRSAYPQHVPSHTMDHPILIVPSSGRATSLRDAKNQVDMVRMNESRLKPSGYSDQAVDSTNREDITYMVDYRDYVGGERERPLIIDDSPPMRRLARRLYEPDGTDSSGQKASVPETYQTHRAKDEEYYRVRQSRLSMNAPNQEGVRPTDPNQMARPVLFTSAPSSYQPRVATEMSSRRSPFPSHSRSHEMSSGQIFHPFHTSSDEPTSRFSASRNQPVVVDSISQPLQRERHPLDNFQYKRPQNGGELHRDHRFGEVSRMSPRYLSLDSRSRVLRAEPEYVPVDSRDRVIRAVPQMPAGVSEFGPSNPRRSVPRRDEVIVLISD